MKTKSKKNLIYHIVCAVLIIASLLCSIFVFGKPVFERTIDSFIDFGTSCAYYVMNPVTLWTESVNPIEATVIKIPESAVSLLPWTWEEFTVKIQIFGQRFINPNNLLLFWSAQSENLIILTVLLNILILIIVLFGALAWRSVNTVNNNQNQDTKPLRVFKKILSVTYTPIKRWLQGFVAFCNQLDEEDKNGYKSALILLWCYNLNFITIIVELFAYFIYFITCFDVLHLYTYVAKLFMDLSVSLTKVPMPVLLIAGLKVFDVVRLWLANTGRHLREGVNKAFVKALSILVLIIGTTGKKKSTILADISLTKEVEFREQAFSAMEINELKFPDFPWCNVRKAIEAAEKRHAIYNLASCRRFIRLLKAAFKLTKENRVHLKDCYKRLRKRYGYAYDNLMFDYHEIKNVKFDNSLYIEDIYDALEAYAQEYYLYRLRTSLIVGNLPIRSRIKWDDEGNLPIMDSDFFNRKSKNIKSESQMSHIVDNDCFRLGKLYNPQNRNVGAIEFGVVDFDEWAKDRGNQVTNDIYEKKSDKANPKNDEFNLDMKTRRQSAMIENEVYLFFIGTEQRAESMNSDLLQLCDIIDIGDKCKFDVGIPFSRVERLFDDIVSPLYSKFWKLYRKNHGNNTLMGFLVTHAYRLWWHYWLKRINEYGYFKVLLKHKLSGTDGNIVKEYIFLQFKKVYAKTFASDTFGAYYSKKSNLSEIGLNDTITYKDVRQTIEEMSLQNSFYVEKLNKTFGGGESRGIEYDWQEEKKDQQAKFICDQQKTIAKQERIISSQNELVTQLQADVAQLREAAQSDAVEPRRGAKKAEPIQPPKEM